MTVTPLGAVLIGALLTGLVWMLASLLSAGERSQADIWRQQWSAASDAVRQLTLDGTTARDERDRARKAAVVLEQKLAEIVRITNDVLVLAEGRTDTSLGRFASMVLAIAHDLRDDEDDEGVGLR